MKAILPRQDFQDALGAIATVTGGRTTKPILSCVKIAARDGAIELSATDGEAGLRIAAPALAVERPGEAVVPADRLLSIVRELADVEISIETDDRHCSIRGAGSAFRIFVMNPADFPPVAVFEDGPDMVMDGAELRRMIGLTIFAAAKETGRYAINGVLWKKAGKRLFLVATDGRRLARSGGGVREANSGDFQAIVPARSLGIFEKVFMPPRDGSPWSVDVKVFPNQVVLRTGGRVLSTVLVEGHFPDYEKVIPEVTSKRARLDRGEFLASVKRAALLTTDESRAVRLSLDGSTLVISSQSPEQGDARVETPMRYEGSPLDIGFNPTFLQDALRAIPYEEIVLELHEDFRPGTISGEDKAEFLYVVMPVQLAN